MRGNVIGFDPDTHAATLLSLHPMVGLEEVLEKTGFPLPSRASWPLTYEGMISARGVAKKRRAQQLAATRVKSSFGVAARQQSWRRGHHSPGQFPRKEPRRPAKPVLNRPRGAGPDAASPGRSPPAGDRSP